MRTASLKMNLNEADDFFSPKVLGRLLGINAKRAYEITQQQGFPCRRLGKKIVISKAGFLRWFEQNAK